MTPSSTRVGSNQDAHQEGVVQFRFRLLAPAANDRIEPELLARLEQHRRKLCQLGLLGRDSNRYDGLAYGNMSVRDPHDDKRFFITASQVGDALRLDASGWPRIDAFDASTFTATVTGDQTPSSETLTHAVVYAATDQVGSVLHVHSPLLWHRGAALGLPATGQSTPYGSARLAREVEALLADHRGDGFVFTTPGHEDGVFACGTDPDTAMVMLLNLLARANR